MYRLQYIKIAVLAGNFMEARFIMDNFYKKYNKENIKLIYIDSKIKALGQDFDDYIIGGIFWKREDAGKIYEETKRSLISRRY